MATDHLEKATQYFVEGVKSAMLLNGGGAVALTTLMAAAGKGDAGIKIKADAAIQAIELFGWGVFAAASAFLMAHYAYLYFDLVEKFQSLEKVPNSRRVLTAVGLQCVSGVLAGGSLLSFVFGLSRASGAFVQ